MNKLNSIKISFRKASNVSLKEIVKKFTIMTKEGILNRFNNQGKKYN